jgi:hypothetical protein
MNPELLEKLNFPSPKVWWRLGEGCHKFNSPIFGGEKCGVYFLILQESPPIEKKLKNTR